MLTTYEEFYCLPKNPFLLTSDPDYLFLTKAHEEALCGMLYTIAHRKGLMVLTGEAGTGKTTLVRKCMTSMPAAKTQFSLVQHPTLTQAEFLDYLLTDFGIAETPGSAVQQLALLQQFLLQLHSKGKSAVLVVDEAHKLSVELLEKIRLLTNFEVPEAKLLQVILVGQSEFDCLLDQECMQQLKQRVVFRFTLSPLSPQEVGAYMQHRWSKTGATTKHPFVEEAVTSITCYSQGIPRLINIICDSALLNAYADGVAWVGEKQVREAAEDLKLLRSSYGAVARGQAASPGTAESDGQVPALLPPSDPHSISVPTPDRQLLKCSTPNGSEPLSRPGTALSQESSGIPTGGTASPAQKGVARPAAWMTRWFGGHSERRRASRFHIPTLCVYHWTGSVPDPHEVVDISENGAYFETRDRWSPGTIIELTLQRVRGTDGSPADPHTSLHVVSRVVRSGPGGLGVQFLYTQRHERLHTREFLARLTSA